MTDIHDLIAHMRRPACLMQAARSGVRDYNRSRHLRRIIGAVSPPSPRDAIHQLLAREAELEATRTDNEPAYNFVRHVEVLIALLGELRLVPRQVV